MGKYSGEQILVIKRSLFDEIGTFQGANKEVATYLSEFMKEDNSFFIDREEAENDPTHKQLIPYCIFKYENKILHYLRGKSGGEARLHAKGSIGVGGHINPIDDTNLGGQETYLAAVNREITEELSINGTYTDKIIGLINDDSNEVGQVHLGVVHLVTLDTDEVTSREDCLTDLTLIPIDELKAERFESLESWSQMALSLLPQ